MITLYFIRSAPLQKAILQQTDSLVIDNNEVTQEGNTYWIDSTKIWCCVKYKNNGSEKHSIAYTDVTTAETHIIPELQQTKRLEINAIAKNENGNFFLIYLASDNLLKATIIKQDGSISDLGDIPVLYAYMIKGAAWCNNAPEIAVYEKEKPFTTTYYRWENKQWIQREKQWHYLLHYNADLYMSKCQNNNWQNYVAFNLNITTGEIMEDSVLFYVDKPNTDTLSYLGKYEITGDRDLWIDRAIANIPMQDFSYQTTNTFFNKTNLTQYCELDTHFCAINQNTEANNLLYTNKNTLNRIPCYIDSATYVYYINNAEYRIYPSSSRNFMGITETYYSIKQGIKEERLSPIPVSKEETNKIPVFYKMQNSYVYMNDKWELAILNSEFDLQNEQSFFDRIYTVISKKSNKSIQKGTDIFTQKMNIRAYFIPFILIGSFLLWIIQLFFMLLKRIFKKKKKYKFSVRRSKKKPLARRFLIVNILYLLTSLAIAYWFVLDSLLF